LPGDAGDDGKATALLRLANDALEREDYAEALRDAQGCLEIDPADHDCFDDELMVYGRTGDFANERILAEECLFDDPDDVGCLESIVVLNARDRDFAAARVAADHLRQLAPNTTSSAIADATIADLSGDLSAALADYERACTLGQEFACFRAQAIRNGAR
jgi:Flp pilus assembly protein TadD